MRSVSRAMRVVSGFFSGFVSSTATIATLGRRARSEPGRGALLAVGGALSTAATWVQVFLMSAAFWQGPDANPLNGVELNWELVLHGEHDDVVPLAAVLDWARPQQTLPVTVIPAGGHFFHGQLPLLKRLVVQHLQAQATPA